MRFEALSFLAISLVVPSLAVSSGYGPWTFGMNKDEVRAVTKHGPFYDFRNGDLGTKNGEFNGAPTPVSFYFKDNRLTRVMVVLYAGTSFDETKLAWRTAFQHIERTFQSAEVPSIRSGPVDLASAERALEESGLREGKNVKLQIGPSPMPKDQAVWCTLDIVPSVGYWVAMNYAEP